VLIESRRLDHAVQGDERGDDQLHGYAFCRGRRRIVTADDLG
jgi:hypothetical protein